MKAQLSIPPTRDLPPGRLPQRRQHLISEIAQPHSRWPLPRRGSLAFAAAALIVVVVGTASAIGGVRDFFFTPGVNSKIAYIQNPRPGAGGDKELWVMSADGSEPKRLSRIASYGRPAWSPTRRRSLSCAASARSTSSTPMGVVNEGSPAPQDTQPPDPRSGRPMAGRSPSR